MLNDATGFKKIYLAAGLSSVYFYPQLFIFLHNYRVNTFKAEDNYYLIPQSLANSSSLSSHSAVSDNSFFITFSMNSDIRYRLLVSSTIALIL